MKFNFRELLFRIWYWYVSNVDKKAEVLFMNYGYSSDEQDVKLSDEDEPNRYSIQLYHHLANSVDLKDKSLLEVGSGRGGGLAYIAKNFPLSTTMGVDLNKRATKFGNSHYKIKGLSFEQGDAQKLSLADNSYDVILNVESSHRYPSMKAFLSEVDRILKPGGYFLYTDFRYDWEMDELKKELESTEFKEISGGLITHNVVGALEKDDHRRRELVSRLVPKMLHKLALDFAGTVGSETYNQFASRKYEYYSCVLQKNI